MFEIRMQHPARNALSPELVGWLEEQLAAAGDAPILLTGSADAFSAGLHLEKVAAMAAPELERFLLRLDDLSARLFLHPAPTVAAVTGHAIAGGCVLALCCDLRVATSNERARIGVNEVALGACYPPAILALVRHRVPVQHHERVMLGAGLFAPAEALALGLVDEIAGDPEAVARTRLAALAKHPRQGYAHLKRLLHEPVVSVSPADRRRFHEVELPQWTSPEMRERLAAVLRK